MEEPVCWQGGACPPNDGWLAAVEIFIVRGGGDRTVRGKGRGEIMGSVGARSRGQGMTEYIIIVALIAVAAIGIISLFGDNIRKLFGASAQSLAGDSSVANPGDSQQHEELRKKKMSNFGQNNSY